MHADSRNRWLELQRGLNVKLMYEIPTPHSPKPAASGAVRPLRHTQAVAIPSLRRPRPRSDQARTTMAVSFTCLHIAVSLKVR